MQARGATEYHKVQQGVTTEAVSTVYRNARHFTTSVKTVNNDIITRCVQRQRLTMNIGRHTTHHVVTGRHNWNGCMHRIYVCKGARQLTDARQLALQYFFAQMIEL